MTGSAGIAELPLDASSLVVEAELPLSTPAPIPALPEELKQHWIEGTAALTTALMVERGTGLLANVLAARFGGAAVFGSYSLAISTANNVSTYAAGGIGATATRFSGKYPFGTREYGSFARALIVVGITSAVLAAVALWAGAVPLARLLEKPALAGLLRWAALSAAAMILLECARGFFVGQRRVAALLLLSLLTGGGLLLVLPASAHTHNAVRMVILQAGVCCAAVIACIAFGRQLALHGNVKRSGDILPMLREVWSFGLVQLSGMIAANVAGWWLTTLIARSDRTLAQVGFFAIASQMRNLAGVVPGLLTEGSYAVMALPGQPASSRGEGAQHRVMAIASYASTAVGSAIACVGIVAAPLILRLLYGKAYLSAQTALAMGLALAVAHMGNAPASARLTIVSIRTAGVINTVWAVFVGLAATLFLLRRGGAWQGMAILLVAHLLSGALVLRALKRSDTMPDGVRLAYYLGAVGSALLACMALLRAELPGRAGVLTSSMCVFALGLIACLGALGKRHHWLPSRAALLDARSRIRLPFRREATHV